MEACRFLYCLRRGRLIDNVFQENYLVLITQIKLIFSFFQGFYEYLKSTFAFASNICTRFYRLRSVKRRTAYINNFQVKKILNTQCSNIND